MGQVRNTCCHQTQGGNEFAGSCACLLNAVMSENFGALPAFFDETVGEEWTESVSAKVFPHFQLIDGVNQVL